MTTTPTQLQPIPDSRRRALLAGAVATTVANGARVEAQAEFYVVMVRGHRTNHLLHLVLTLATCGLWGFGWFVFAVTVREQRWVLSVDEHGRILTY